MHIMELWYSQFSVDTAIISTLFNAITRHSGETHFHIIHEAIYHAMRMSTDLPRECINRESTTMIRPPNGIIYHSFMSEADERELLNDGAAYYHLVHDYLRGWNLMMTLSTGDDEVTAHKVDKVNKQSDDNGWFYMSELL
jgi:hypothetical protein